MSYRSPIPPPPRPGLLSRVIKGVVFAFAGLAAFVIYLASTLFVGPIVQSSIDAIRAMNAPVVEARILPATFLGERLAIPCLAFEDEPAGCEEASPSEVAFGPGVELAFFGSLPDAAPVFGDRRPGSGVAYALSRRRADAPTGEAALSLARETMGRYGPTAERRTAPGVIRIEGQAGSRAEGRFMAVYDRGDGVLVPASCFGTVCRVLQAPWRGEAAYGLTVQATRADELPAIDAAVRARLDSFRAP